MVKNLPANAGDIRDGGSFPGSGRSLEEGMESYSSILTENPMDRGACPWLPSIGSQRVGHN